jgi:hypothetical protein
MKKNPNQQIKNEYNKQWRLKNVVKNKEQKKKDNAKYRAKNKAALIAINKVYMVEYRKNNKERINEQNKAYNLKKRNTNPLYKLTTYIRSLIGNSIRNKGYIKNQRTFQILGCNFDEFKTHIEYLWEPWMNWDNYGNPKDGVLEPNKTWDLDHIIPLSSAITEQDIIRLNHHTNFQPLCSYRNRIIKKDVV